MAIIVYIIIIISIWIAPLTQAATGQVIVEVLLLKTPINSFVLCFAVGKLIEIELLCHNIYKTHLRT